MMVLDPKILKSEKKTGKRDRIVYKLDYDYPDINQIKKYGKITAIKPHSCTPAPKLFGIKREFRHTNGKLSLQPTLQQPVVKISIRPQIRLPRRILPQKDNSLVKLRF